MGNASKTPRSSTTSLSITNVQRLSSGSLPGPTKSSVPLKVAQQTLAPEVLCESSDLECPICFLNYSALNSTLCCKQNICTGCFTLIKTKPITDNGNICPYCSQKHLHVVYDPSSYRKQTKSDHIRIEEPTKSSTAKVPIVAASVDDRKTIEEQILKHQRVFREEISSTSSTFYSRSFDQYRPYGDRRRLQIRSRIGSTTDSNHTAESDRNNSMQAIFARRLSTNQSLTDRLERLLLYYNGAPTDEHEHEAYGNDDHIMSLSDIANLSGRRGSSTHTTRNPTSGDTEARSQSSAASSQPYSSEEANDNLIETMFGHTTQDNMQTLEDLEEIMILEAMRLSLVETQAPPTESAPSPPKRIESTSTNVMRATNTNESNNEKMAVPNNNMFEMLFNGPSITKASSTSAISVARSPVSNTSDEDLSLALNLSMANPNDSLDSFTKDSSNGKESPVASSVGHYDETDLFGSMDIDTILAHEELNESQLKAASVPSRCSSYKDLSNIKANADDDVTK